MKLPMQGEMVVFSMAVGKERPGAFIACIGSTISINPNRLR